MPRGVLVVFSQRGRLTASSLCSLGSLVFTADLLLWIRHALWARSSLWCTFGSAGSSFRYTSMPLCFIYSSLIFLPYTPHLSYTGSATLSWYTNWTLLDTN